MKQIARHFVGKVVHSSIVQEVLRYKENRDLGKLVNDNYPVNHLLKLTSASLQQVFDNSAITGDWAHIQDVIETLELPDMTGGVNRGDQRAIYYLIRHFKPNKVLEVGTHIGCSTVHIALALNNNAASHLTTVDIIDVNDPIEKNWMLHNSKHSPAELMEIAGVESKVDFVTVDSTKYLKNCKEKFDFVFLDGSHQAKVVFQEIPLAMRLLNEDGIILLHDFFPGNKPIWKNVSTIPGPYLAVERIIREEKNLSVLPLGELPWKTKKNSNYTSLALLTRQH